MRQRSGEVCVRIENMQDTEDAKMEYKDYRISIDGREKQITSEEDVATIVRILYKDTAEELKRVNVTEGQFCGNGLGGT